MLVVVVVVEVVVVLVEVDVDVGGTVVFSTCILVWLAFSESVLTIVSMSC